MRMDDAFTTLAAEGLHVCTACELPFVTATDVLDIIDGDRCVVELRCNNCGAGRVGAYEDEQLEDLDIDVEASLDMLRGAV